jgi:hypothetical protein
VVSMRANLGTAGGPFIFDFHLDTRLLPPIALKTHSMRGRGGMENERDENRLGRNHAGP